MKLKFPVGHDLGLVTLLEPTLPSMEDGLMQSVLAQVPADLIFDIFNFMISE